MAEGNKLHLRLFLEGIEVPVISAAVQVTANTTATCSIQIIATDKVMDLLPRTIVHLFYYDYIQAGNIATDRKVRGGYELEDWNNSKYKLLFMGELVTLKFQKNHTQRMCVLECADFSNYWDTTFQYNFGGSLFGGRRKAAFIGANSNFFTSPLGHGTGTVSRLLNGRSVNFPQLKGLLAGVVRMLEAIGGSYYGRNSFRGANDFTSIAELRIKVLQQITAAEDDTSTSKLFARKAFNMWMNRSAGSLGKLVSFRGLLKMCFGFIFHEVYPCPVAKFVPASTRKDKKRWSVGLGKTKYTMTSDAAKRCLDLCNEAIQDMSSWRKSKLGSTGPTGPRVSTATTRYVRSWLAFDRAAKELSQLVSVMGPAKSQKDAAIVSQLASSIRGLSTNSGGVISANIVSVKGAPRGLGKLDRNYDSILVKYRTAKNALGRILGIKVGRSKSINVPTEARVNNQIFRPDVWFSPPPRCNVLFPETYDSFSFSRQYLREVSRLELQTHNEILGKDALFNGRYYAPNVADVRRGAKLSSRRFARLIMEHELYTGIIPMFENLSEANLFSMRAGKTTKGGSKVGYAQRAVNFQYFKYRFESRGMDASGRFNPPMVAGFPALVIDKNMDHTQLSLSSQNLKDQAKALGVKGDATRSELLQKLVSPQYLAVCAAMSHTVSQEGGRTSYQFIHARVHRETTEFMGVDKATVCVPTGLSTSKDIVAALPSNPPRVKGRGTAGGKITSVKDVTKQHMGRFFTIWGDAKAAKVRIGSRDDVRATFNENQSTDKSGKSSTDSFKAYEIKESRTKYKKTQIDLPIEEAIRPPWIWDGWANPKISETYDQLIGTGALTDIGGFGISHDNPSEGTRAYLGEDDVAGLQDQRAEELNNSLRGKSAKRKKTAREAAKVEAAKAKNAVLMQDQERTVENSVDFLIRSYSFVKLNNLDVGDFLRAYSWRPVATMVEILGGSDLEIKPVPITVKKSVKRKILKRKTHLIGGTSTTGKPESSAFFTEDTQDPQSVVVEAKYGYKYITRTYTKIGYEVSGKEGFHSRAFGDIEDLFGLVSPTVKRVLGLSDNKRKVAAKLDVRKRRRAVVRLYVAELMGSRGLVG